MSAMQNTAVVQPNRRKSLKQWLRSMRGQQILVTLVFLFVPLLLLVTFTYLPFWMSLKDETHGGYYGLVDFDLQVDRQAEKGCILNSRILWFFSEAAMLTGRADAAACARHAYQWFEDHCFDRENGGVYWSCDALGRPLDTTKHTYNQAFAIYALSAYYRLTG